ncbi:fluoride efflux transporter CrcB [Oleiharenicola lentus]|uniref:fluoride efflux transporter CrcB n=1 Tax=Oleiharenicola lentus TaxID=2508720 RepID=UPI003F67D925
MNQVAALGLVALGGAAGSVFRALVGMALVTRFPWATLLINVVGSLLIGYLMARLGPLESVTAASLRSVLVVGFCGGFTTFSAFSWQTLEQMLRGEWGAAVANVLLSVVICLFAVWAGYRLGHA